jgi:hypothetical protein
MTLKSMGVAAWVGVIAIFNVLPATAASVTYTTSLQSGSMCTGCGPFGTVVVSSVTGQPRELSVTLTLSPGEVFASTGAGSALLFDIANNPTLSVSGVTAGFAFHQASTHADGSGTWNTYIACDVCGSGTSPPQNSGPVSFILSVASGTLTPSSFVTNGSYLFASDIGVPIPKSSPVSYTTGDVVTSSSLTAVPLPAAAWLLLSGVGGLGALTRMKIRPDVS